MNPTFKTVSRMSVANQQNYCYLCDVNVQNTHIRNVDQLFYEDSRKLQSKPLATILSDILEQNIDEPTVHSKIVCRKCQQMCIEYDRLSERMQKLKQNITNNFNETINKYNLRVIEMNMEQNYEVINENDDVSDSISNIYAIESVDATIGDVFNNENLTSCNDTNKTTKQMKKLMLIKSENGSNPFFAISGMDESIDDDQHIHTVSEEK